MTHNPESARGRRPAQGEPVVDRALSLLAVFSDRQRTLGLSELARGAGIPPATALRLLRRLQAWGAVERLEDGRYVVGVRLWEVASLAPRGHGIRDVALPYLEDLCEVTRHHVLLAVREGNEAVLIDRLSARNATEVAYRVGGRLPLQTTAVGLILLSDMEQPAQSALLETPPPPEPGNVPPSQAQLRAMMAALRTTGTSTVHRTAPSRTVSVAAPIRDATRNVVAALSVVVPEGAAPPRVLAPAVSTAGLAISRQLGFLPRAVDRIRG